MIVSRLGADVAAELQAAARSAWWVRAYAPGGWVERMRDRARAAPANDSEPAMPDPGAPLDEKCSDLGNARRLIRMHGADIRHCSARDV